MTVLPKAAPPFDGSPKSLSILKKAARDLKPLINLTEQASQIVLWSQENAKQRFGLRPVSLDRKKWADFVKREPTYTTRQADLPRLAWEWFFEVCPYTIEPLWQKRDEHDVAETHTLASALNSFLTPKKKSIDLDVLGLLAGTYIVFRPSFLNHDDVMVMKMVCGIDGDPSRFTIVMTFQNEEDEPSTENVEGFAIPYQDCILFQGRLKQTGSPFIFVMSRFPIDPKTGKYARADGTLLAGASGSLSSAYPITMRRSSKPLDPDTLSPERFQAEIRTHKEIADFFKRGVVSWR